MKPGWTTVRDQMRRLKMQYSKQLHWQSGALCREKYREIYGKLPDKELMNKTLRKGSYCIAVYPPEFIPEIVSILTRLKEQDEAQGWLF